MLILFPFFRELEIHGNCAVLLPPRWRNGRVKYGPSNLAVLHLAKRIREISRLAGNHRRRPGLPTDRLGRYGGGNFVERIALRGKIPSIVGGNFVSRKVRAGCGMKFNDSLGETCARRESAGSFDQRYG